MTNRAPVLEVLLHSFAVAQMFIALLNLALVRIMGWETELTRLRLLIREVFQVHSWFISATVAISSRCTVTTR